jgi:(1->4)-alpha-D-glucan 1-alpha-D-glucosylmutase
MKAPQMISSSGFFRDRQNCWQKLRISPVIFTPQALPKAWRKLKQFLIARVLAARRDLPGLFSNGTYKPLKIVGAAAENFIGFARVLDGAAAITLFCRFTAQLFGGEDIQNISRLLRKDERLLVWPELQGIFTNALLDEQISIGHEVDLKLILRNLPVGLFVKAPDHWRTASN